MSGRNGEEEGQSPSSVVTVSTPPQSLPSPILSDRKLKDKCFRCGMKGHWAQDCPFANPTRNASSLPDVHHFPVLRCPCGVACTLRVSGSETHYGRRYYAHNCNCGNGPGKNFYKWCEDVKAPLCKCGAGACTINFHNDTHGNYVKYYTCRIRTVCSSIFSSFFSLFWRLSGFDFVENFTLLWRTIFLFRSFLMSIQLIYMTLQNL